MGKKRAGLVHIYTGCGKGKTTAAFGLALRAVGSGLRVLCVQFLKGRAGPSGEVKALRRLKGAAVIRYGQRHPVFWKPAIRRDSSRYKAEFDKLRSSLIKSIEEVQRLILSRRYDVVILDEIINAVSSGIIAEALVLDVICSKPNSVELVLTGRGASKKLFDAADYATVMHEKKHPLGRGVKARKGIEK